MNTVHWLVPLSLAAMACSADVTDDPAVSSAAALGGSSIDADAATQALVDRYWNGAYLKDADPATPGSCGLDACYWIYAQAFDAVLDAVQRTGGKRFAGWIGRLYDAQDGRGWIEPHASRYFDDENWMALALIRAFDATGDRKYLCHAVQLYRDVKSEGFDRPGGHFDGIWWNAAHTQKATASNLGPAITAARLHERPAMNACPEAAPGFVDSATAANDARAVYHHWRTTMTRSDGQGDLEVADHAASGCPGGVCWWDFTYDQGLAIGAALELHHITGEHSYVSDAYGYASYMIHHETAGGVLHDGGACGGDCAAFKGIGYRFLLKLYELDRSQTQYGDVLRASAQSIWNTARDGARDTFGTSWAAPAPARATLAADASAVMALNLAVEWGVE
ncbi:MAG TPA: glycoside hydrolase family 76 protein [Polyangiaceae bacterium]